MNENAKDPVSAPRVAARQYGSWERKLLRALFTNPYHEPGHQGATDQAAAGSSPDNSYAPAAANIRRMLMILLIAKSSNRQAHAGDWAGLSLAQRSQTRFAATRVARLSILLTKDVPASRSC